MTGQIASTCRRSGFLIRRSALAIIALLAFTVADRRVVPKLAGRLSSQRRSGRVLRIHPAARWSVNGTNRCRPFGKIEEITSKLPGVNTYFVLGGLDIATGTSNSNVATLIATLKPWDERHSKETQIESIIAQAQAEFAGVPEAFSFAFGLPPILGLSPTGGFQFMLEDRAGGDIAGPGTRADALVNARGSGRSWPT